VHKIFQQVCHTMLPLSLSSIIWESNSKPCVSFSLLLLFEIFVGHKMPFSQITTVCLRARGSSCERSAHVNRLCVLRI